MRGRRTRHKFGKRRRIVDKSTPGIHHSKSRKRGFLKHVSRWVELDDDNGVMERGERKFKFELESQFIMLWLETNLSPRDGVDLKFCSRRVSHRVRLLGFHHKPWWVWNFSSLSHLIDMRLLWMGDRRRRTELSFFSLSLSYSLSISLPSFPVLSLPTLSNSCILVSLSVHPHLEVTRYPMETFLFLPPDFSLPSRQRTDKGTDKTCLLQLSNKNLFFFKNIFCSLYQKTLKYPIYHTGYDRERESDRKSFRMLSWGWIRILKTKYYNWQMDQGSNIRQQPLVDLNHKFSFLVNSRWNKLTLITSHDSTFILTEDPYLSNICTICKWWSSWCRIMNVSSVMVSGQMKDAVTN